MKTEIGTGFTVATAQADDGRIDAIVLFEPADLDAAYGELDARFAELRRRGEAR